jgi:hypothetical protein
MTPPRGSPRNSRVIGGSLGRRRSAQKITHSLFRHTSTKEKSDEILAEHDVAVSFSSRANIQGRQITGANPVQDGQRLHFKPPSNDRWINSSDHRPLSSHP